MSMLIPELEELIPAGHTYRKLLGVIDWAELSRPLSGLYSTLGRRGYLVEQGLVSQVAVTPGVTLDGN